MGNQSTKEEELIDACEKGDRNLVELLIKNEADVNHEDEDKWTPNFFASQNGHKEIVEILIKNGADVNHEDENKWTPIFFASLNGHKEIVELLIKNGARLHDDMKISDVSD